MTKKKLMAMLLATTVITSSLGMNVMAEEKQEKAVKATYVSSETDAVYSVDIVIGDMAFNFVEASEGAWDPEKHEYVGSKVAEWKYNGKNQIKVTNHSNAEVNVKLTYTSETGFEAVTGTYSRNDVTLPTAVGTTVEAAPYVESELTLNGNMPKSESASKIGTVTVKVSHK